MALPPPGAERSRLHSRRVSFDGFKRADGLWDIEAHMIDRKDQDYPLSSGVRRAGEAVHEMWVRVTIDGKFNVVDALCSTDAAPYMGACDGIAPDYARIVGLNLFHGFLKSVKELFGGTRGCAHLTELLMSLPTVALQTFASEIPDNLDSEHKPYHVDRCHALDSHSETVRRYYPRWYRGPSHGQPSLSNDRLFIKSKEGE